MNTPKKRSRKFALALAAILTALPALACSGWPFQPAPEKSDPAAPQPTWTVQPTYTPFPTITPLPSATPTERVIIVTQTPLPTSTSTPQVIVVTATPVPNVGSTKRRVVTATPVASNTWFFQPHPEQTLRNMTVYSVSMQTFERGFVLALQEKKQTWAFTYPETGEAAIWGNKEGALADVATFFNLGAARGDKRQLRACGGDILENGYVTAFVQTGDKRVVAWTIHADDFAPVGWGYLDVTMSGCGVTNDATK